MSMDESEWEEDIFYLIKKNEAECRMLIAQYDFMKIGYRVCQKGCGEYYNPDWGHRCE